MSSRFRSSVLPFGIFGAAVLAIVAAVWVLPSTARGETRHQHLKGDILPAGTIQAQFRRVVERFTTQIWRLDLEVARIKGVWRTTGRGQRDPFIEKQTQDLELRRQAVLSTLVADLPRDLGIRGAEKVRSFMLNRVRRHSKIYPKGVAQ